MKKAALLTLFAMTLGAGCKMPQFIQGGEKDGVTVSYRWNHPANKPSELLLKVVNASPSAQHVQIELDLSHQAFTVETLSADTCIPAGRTFNGKLNGIYFIPARLSPEQAASPDTRVEISRFEPTRTDHCP